MINIIKPKNITTTLRELNRARLDRRHARKKGLPIAQAELDRKKRTPYATSTTVNASGNRPLVSIIVVGSDIECHLPALTESLKNQTYRNFEVIYVDNASHDNSIATMRRLCPEAIIIENQDNVGFSESNNIGADHADGEFLLLLSNDAKLSDTALEHMVITMCSDARVGAVAPKIRFWEPFDKIKINTNSKDGQLHINVKESTTGYKKAIKVNSKSLKTQEFLIPISTREIEVFRSPAGQAAPPDKSTPAWQGTVGDFLATKSNTLTLEHTDAWILANVGYWVNALGETGAWGHGEADLGQYDTPCMVDAFSKYCALIRRSSLGLKPLFPTEFFAYYEGTDASERIRRAGYYIVYQPTAIAYHQYASTAAEGSLPHLYFTNRNGLAFQARYFPTRFHLQSEENFDRWQKAGISSYTTEQFLKNSTASSNRSLVEDTLRIAAQATNGALYKRSHPRTRVGVFNEYWSSMGGGELRALHIALAMRDHGDVHLISRTPVDIIKICNYFNLPHAGLKLSVIPDFSDKDTADVDIFINTSFSSTIYSRARKSIFIVSFPHTHGHISEMLSYDLLLANSFFTQHWCHNYWPTANTQLLYPAVKVEESYSFPTNKECTIVSIGRFFPSGHSKRQLEMVEAFRKLIEMGHSNWRLVLIGGCNTAKSQDQEYLDKVKRAANGLPIDIHVDATSSVVHTQLQRASIYWHATGVDLKDHAPISFEHFGMAIVEAMNQGAVPIIHNRGGATEIVQDQKSGYHFDTLDALVDKTDQLIRIRKESPSAYEEMSKAAHLRSLEFSLEKHNQTLKQLLVEYVL